MVLYITLYFGIERLTSTVTLYSFGLEHGWTTLDHESPNDMDS